MQTNYIQLIEFNLTKKFLAHPLTGNFPELSVTSCDLPQRMEFCCHGDHPLMISITNSLCWWKPWDMAESSGKCPVRMSFIKQLFLWLVMNLVMFTYCIWFYTYFTYCILGLENYPYCTDYTYIRVNLHGRCSYFTCRTYFEVLPVWGQVKLSWESDKRTKSQLWSV